MYCFQKNVSTIFILDFRIFPHGEKKVSTQLFLIIHIANFHLLLFILKFTNILLFFFNNLLNIS